MPFSNVGGVLAKQFAAAGQCHRDDENPRRHRQ
jgi:hypothetical protein